MFLESRLLVTQEPWMARAAFSLQNTASVKLQPRWIIKSSNRVIVESHERLSAEIIMNTVNELQIPHTYKSRLAADI